MTPRVYVLTIPYPDWVCESDRALTHVMLRRRADGPLVVRERAGDKAYRSKDRSKLRYTGGRPFVQAVFSDQVALGRVQQDLRTFVPHLPKGVVRFERRRAQRPERPCTCVLPALRALQAGVPAFPHYSQVAECQRHAHLLTQPCPQPRTSLVQQQVGALVQGFPATPSSGPALLVDELPALHSRPAKSAGLATLAATLARGGAKVALYG
jgi:hypothetical protein